MATQRESFTFRCPRCGTDGKVTVAETDHPYQTDSWIEDVTDGFRADAGSGLSARVTCETCKTKVL